MTRKQIVEKISELREKLRKVQHDQSEPIIQEINKLSDRLVKGEYDDAD